jgi:hypothetical protein
MAILSRAINDQGSGNYTHEILTVPAENQYAITTIMVCNTYDPSATAPENETSVFDLHFVPSGNSLDINTTCVVRKLQLPAGETFTFDSEKIVLNAGDKAVIVGSAPANLAATISYLEV